jgi:hypothetical protein
MTSDEFDEWVEKRKEWGSNKYGDDHKERYTVLDEMEEILDLLHIHEKGGKDRILKYALNCDNELAKQYILRYYNSIKIKAEEIKECLLILDKMLPDEICSDEKGGERIGLDDGEITELKPTNSPFIKKIKELKSKSIKPIKQNENYFNNEIKESGD